MNQKVSEMNVEELKNAIKNKEKKEHKFTDEEKLEEALKNIYKSINGLKVYEAVTLLEQAKLDLRFNSGSVKIDGVIGFKK